jgi:predicted dehydrogenase
LAALRVGVIGYGYWGPHIVRSLLEIPEASVPAAVDRDPARIEQLRFRHPHIERISVDYADLFDLGLDAVVVSTPPETHFEIVSTCLEQGLDVLVEKPLATSLDQALRLVDLAKARDRIMMVGHIGVYHPAVRALKQMIESGDMGDIRYVDAVRVGLGVFHPKLNVIWDLAPHDISILLHVLGESPWSVSTRGVACVQEAIEDVAYMTLAFPSGILAHARMSWLDPCKTRRITVIGSKKMVVYDDLEIHEKLKIYDQSVNAIRRTDTFGEFQFAYHYGSVLSPYIHFEEPLRLECLHFLECVREHKQPLTDGRSGIRVIEVIEAAQRSLREGGIQVMIDAHADKAANLRYTSIQIPIRAHHNGVLAQEEGPREEGHDGAHSAVTEALTSNGLRPQRHDETEKDEAAALIAPERESNGLRNAEAAET